MYIKYKIYKLIPTSFSKFNVVAAKCKAGFLSTFLRSSVHHKSCLVLKLSTCHVELD